MRHRLVGAAALAVTLLVLVPAVALAHPLGNFTINHYAGIRVAPNEIDVDVVVDQAEIPTFQVRQEIDANGDGDVSDAEADAARIPRCTRLIASLALTVAGTPQSLELTAAGLEFPAGAGGLPTMRLVCELRSPLSAPIGGTTHISFTDGSFAERIGWREITVVGDRTTISGSAAATSVSERLTHYPADLLQQPLAMRSLAFDATPGGPAAPSFSVPDARPLITPSTPPVEAKAPAAATGAQSAESGAAGTSGGSVVPGGIGGEIDDLLRSRDLTPIVLLGSILAAVALGAGHAITPGHGKTLMGAYLIGARGTPVHALGLGLAVAVSHTLGILCLALVVVAAGSALPPDEFQRLAPIVSAATLTAVGGWLLVGQLRRLRRERTEAAEAAHPHRHPHDHEHPRDHEHAHPHVHPHTHGLVPHTHAAAPGTTLTWRSLFVLGLAGGLVPSTNALLILLATIATNRPAFGLVLVVAFGLGMAAVMAGVGLALLYARDWLESRPRLPVLRAMSALGRATAWAPAAAAVFVTALGVVLTSEALGVARL